MARGALALLLVLAALLAPSALAATCVYCNGDTRLSCYTGIPIAPTCRWWGSSSPVSLRHCGTVAHCDDTITSGGITYELKVGWGLGVGAWLEGRLRAVLHAADNAPLLERHGVP